MSFQARALSYLGAPSLCTQGGFSFPDPSVVPTHFALQGGAPEPGARTRTLVKRSSRLPPNYCQGSWLNQSPEQGEAWPRRIALAKSCTRILMLQRLQRPRAADSSPPCNPMHSSQRCLLHYSRAPPRYPLPSHAPTPALRAGSRTHAPHRSLHEPAPRDTHSCTSNSQPHAALQPHLPLRGRAAPPLSA